MTRKVTSGDEEQRRHQTRAARIQSGLAPEDDGVDDLPGNAGEPSTQDRVRRNQGTRADGGRDR